MKKLILITICLVMLGPICGAVVGTQKPSGKKNEHITVTVLYDNYVFAKGLKSNWGFSCVLTGTEKNILFHTGAKGELLLNNIEKLRVKPKDIEVVVS